MKSPLPKLARSFAEAVGLARRETDPDKIEAALAEARKNAEAAVSAREAAEDLYRESLLDTDVAESERRLAAVASARVEIDRNEALVAALVKRLGDARAEQDRARRAAIHADATAKCEAIKARLGTEYRHHAIALRALLRDLAEAEVVRIEANKVAGDLGYIESPEERARGSFSLPEEIVSRETVELWVLHGDVNPMPAESQGKVRADPNRPARGYYQHPGATEAWLCHRQRFERVRFREATADPNLVSLLRAVSLPTFAAFGSDFITPERFRSPDTALAHLTGEVGPAPVIERTISERLIPVQSEPEPPAADGAEIHEAA